jgi:hypothetical protein
MRRAAVRILAKFTIAATGRLQLQTAVRIVHSIAEIVSAENAYQKITQTISIVRQLQGVQRIFTFGSRERTELAKSRVFTGTHG